MTAANKATAVAIAGIVPKYLLNLFILSLLQKSGLNGPNMFVTPHRQHRLRHRTTSIDCANNL